MFNGFLDPVLLPVLNGLGTLGFVVLIALVVSLITVLVYKFTTDQVLMKNIKEELDKLNKEAKKNLHDQKKAMEVQKQMFSKQMVMMKHSMTTTLITFLPIIILFSWLNAHLMYVPINADEQFTVTVNFDNYVGNAALNVPNGLTIVDNATKTISPKLDWRLSGKPGEYLLEWKIGDKSYTKDVFIGENNYADATKIVNDGIVKTIQINYKQTKVLDILGLQIGWLWSYIIFAVIFSMVLRKVLKVY